MNGAFPPEVKAALRDNQREFELRPAGDGADAQIQPNPAHVQVAAAAPEGSHLKIELRTLAPGRRLQKAKRTTQTTQTTP